MWVKLVSFMALLSLANGFALSDWNILRLGKKQLGVLDGASLRRYCRSWRFNVELHNVRDFDVVPEECIEHIGYYMTSPQYKSDSQKAVEECQLYLANCCKLKGDGKDGWIFDIDDTLLSTLPYFSVRSFGGEWLNYTCLEEWMRELKATALPNSLTLFNDIKARGFKIFLVSARREVIRDATVDNLINEGYHGWTSLILRGSEDEFKRIKYYKAEVRARLVDEGYRIWGIVGDQWSSFEGSPSARRTFKLPNPMYYVS